MTTATFEDCVVYRNQPRAILVLIPDQEGGRSPIGKVWIPKAAIDWESEVPFASLRGYLIVKRWFAEKERWVD